MRDCIDETIPNPFRRITSSWARHLKAISGTFLFTYIFVSCLRSHDHKWCGFGSLQANRKQITIAVLHMPFQLFQANKFFVCKSIGRSMCTIGPVDKQKDFVKRETLTAHRTPSTVSSQSNLFHLHNANERAFALPVMPDRLSMTINHILQSIIS